MTLGKFRVKELARERGLTQEQLSHRSGVTISTVRRLWQNDGTTDPRGSTLMALATALGVAIPDLYNQQDEESALADIDPRHNALSLAGVPA